MIRLIIGYQNVEQVAKSSPRLASTPDNLEIWGVQYAPGYKLIMTVVEAKINEKPNQFKTLKLIPS